MSEDEYTMSDLISLEFYTNKMAHELDNMSKRADRDSKQIIEQKIVFFKQKNIILQRIIMKKLESFEWTKSTQHE